jgi:predicted GH43/DUF377 family glycosyl hydrolase
MAAGNNCFAGASSTYRAALRFAVTFVEPLQIDSDSPLREMYKLSPFVWNGSQGYEILIRAVPHSDNPAEKIARIYHGRSTDGIRFRMGNQAVIPPGPGEDDRDGCEDPTVALVDGDYYVYYTGWNEHLKRGQLLFTCGPDMHHLEKRGVALGSTASCANPKEATISQTADGSWRLFFEYAREGASRIGIAAGASVAGPWRMLDPILDVRSGSWDSWHLSTGPVCGGDGATRVMFYNGAAKDAAWRIGWVAFDQAYSRVVERSVDPILAPPAVREGDATDIAFAASAVEEGSGIRLYYSIADKDMYCACLRQV